MEIIFQPEGKKVHAASKDHLLKIAEQAGILIDASCAGAGKCGKCKVKVLAVIGSGKCGTNVSWKLDSSGTLTLKGKGPIRNYMSGETYLKKPWDKHSSKIKKIVIKYGITSIGENAFSGLTVDDLFN